MSYQLNSSIHNTQWVTGHFHLIFGGAIVIMYFAIAYDLWPHLTGRALTDLRLMRAQLWLWFIGMMVTTFPWHWVGILGMPRRMAYFDYSDPAMTPEAVWVSLSACGAFRRRIRVLFFVVLVRGHMAPRSKLSRIGLPLRCISRLGSGSFEQLCRLGCTDDRPHRYQLWISILQLALRL